MAKKGSAASAEAPAVHVGSREVWVCWLKRDGFPITRTSEEHAQIYEKRGQVKILGDKYKAQEFQDRQREHADALAAKGRADEIEVEDDDGIRDVHLDRDGAHFKE